MKVKGMPLQEADTEDLEEVYEELDKMLEEGEGTDGDAYAYVEIGHELHRRKEE